jgi:hypothetical protein
MWDLQTARMTRKFTGQRQGSHIIRSCFGGAMNNFIASGSEGTKILNPIYYSLTVNILFKMRRCIYGTKTLGYF